MNSLCILLQVRSNQGVRGSRATRVLRCFVVAIHLFIGVCNAEGGLKDNEILVGSCSALSGSERRFGTELTSAGRAYFSEVNETGGIHGRKIMFHYYNDQYDPKLAEACFQRLLSEGALSLALLTGRAASLRYAELAEAKQIPVIGFSHGAGFLYKPLRRHVFATRASYADEIEQMIDHLWNDAGVRRFAVVHSAGGFEKELLHHLRKALATRGTEPIAVDFNPSQADSSPKETRAAPEAVLLAVRHTAATAAVRQVRSYGWRPILFAASGSGLETLPRLSEELDGVVVAEAVPSLERIDLPTVANYRRLLAKHVPDQEPSAIGLRGFLAAMILVEGIERVGKDPTRERLVAAIESIQDWDAGLGPGFRIRYGPQDHHGTHNVFFNEVRAGKLKPLTDWRLRSKNSP